MLLLIIKNREAAIVASNIFLSCFFSRKSIASSTFCMHGAESKIGGQPELGLFFYSLH